MKLKTLLFWLSAFALLAAATAQYWVYLQAQTQARLIAAQFLGYGQLRYERVWANFWGSGRVWNLSFEPTGVTQALTRSPLGYRVYARELQIHRYRPGSGGNPTLVEATLRGLRVPVIDTRSARRPPGQAWPPPTLAELGYTELRFDLDFTLRLAPESDLALLQINALDADVARFFVDAQIEGAASRFRTAPDQLALRKLRLEYTDRGLISRIKQVTAARAQMGEPAIEQAMIEQLDRSAAQGRWKWTPQSAQALKQFVRNTDYGVLTLDPPGDVRLRNLNLYAAGDWPVLLGFDFSTAGSFDHPAPGKPLR